MRLGVVVPELNAEFVDKMLMAAKQRAVSGSIVKETSLEEYIFSQLAGKLMDLSLEHGKPVCLGVSGPGIYWDDEVRQAGAEVYARMAVDAAFKMVKRLEKLRCTKPQHIHWRFK